MGLFRDQRWNLVSCFGRWILGTEPLGKLSHAFFLELLEALHAWMLDAHVSYVKRWWFQGIHTAEG